VLGAYSGWLETVAGQAQLARNRADEAYAALGDSLQGVRLALSDAVAWMAGKLQAFVGGIQLLGNDIGYFFSAIPPRIAQLFGWILRDIGEALAGNRILMTVFGDGFEEMAQRAAFAGT